MARWVRAAMYHRAQRFTDVIDTLNGHLEKFRDDRYLAQAANVALGIAYAHLGEFDPAERYLRDVEATAGEFPSARHSALWFLGLIARERGEETEAVALLRRLNAEAPSPQINGAITDPGFRLDRTAEAIAARTDPWDPSSGPGADELAGAAAGEEAGRPSRRGHRGVGSPDRHDGSQRADPHLPGPHAHGGKAPRDGFENHKVRQPHGVRGPTRHGQDHVLINRFTKETTPLCVFENSILLSLGDIDMLFFTAVSTKVSFHKPCFSRFAAWLNLLHLGNAQDYPLPQTNV